MNTTDSLTRTPARSPGKRKAVMTQEQKQALIDNLQLEITERARKLRAQYALQSQSLRARVEMRVNRIPLALRKANMGELLAKHSDTIDPKPKSVTASSKPVETVEKVDMADSVPVYSNDINYPQLATKASPAPTRGTKRTSDELVSVDKENVSMDDLVMPKKRARISASGATPRTMNQPLQVLSPKSSNSRTLPHSPIHPVMSPMKSLLARPVSPLKPAAPAASALADMVEKARTTRAAGRKPTPAASTTMPVAAAATAAGGRAKRGATAAVRPPPVTHPIAANRGRIASNTSEASNATTVVTATSKRAAPAKKGTAASKVAGVNATGKKVAASVAKTEAPLAGRRVLRKRN